MGRIDTPGKPLGASQDPATSAKVAAAKSLQAQISHRQTAGDRKIADIKNVKNAIQNLDEFELRHLLHRLIESQPGALATVKSYCAPSTCETPLGAADKPYPFEKSLARCAEEAEGFRKGYWFDLNEQRFWRQRRDFCQDAREIFDGEIEDIRKLCCTGPIIHLDTKIQGIETLFAIVDIVRKIGPLRECDWNKRHGHQIELTVIGHDAVEAALTAMTDEERGRFEASSDYSTLMQTFGELKVIVEDYRENTEWF
jgi:hypothetical protein